MKMAIIYIIAIVVLLGLCITIHEFGHFLGALIVGIKTKVFSIGFGKGLIKKQIGDTTFQIAPIPLGGYCQFYGEDPSEEREGKSYEFLTAHPLKRLLVVIMGPFFNLLLGILIFFIMNMVGFDLDTNKVLVPNTKEGGKYISAAYEAGMRNGDTITQINGEDVNAYKDIVSSVAFENGKKLDIQVNRDGKILNFGVTPVQYKKKDTYKIGVMPYGEEVIFASIVKDSAADKAGLKKYDVVKSVNGNKQITKDLNVFVDYIQKHNGENLKFEIERRSKPMTITVVPEKRRSLFVKHYNKDGEVEVDFKTDKMDLIEHAIKNGELKINGRKIRTLAEINKYSGKQVVLENAGGKYKGVLEYRSYGMIGVYPALNSEKIHVEYGPGKALVKAFVDPWDFVALNLKGLGKLFSGKLDARENLSGPVAIAKIAGDTAYYGGIGQFFLLMAQISIILMIMNLLPIPAVDGSYIIFFIIEAIMGRPLNQKVMEVIQTIGVVLIIALSIFVIFNDVVKLFF